MLKPRTLILSLAGCFFVIAGLVIVYDRDISIFLLKLGSSLKGKAEASDWALKLKGIGWEGVKSGSLLLVWAAAVQFFIKPEVMPRVSSPESATGFKREYIYFTLSFFSSILLYCIIAYIISKLYHPDIEAIRERAAAVTILDPSSFNPKPLERLLFLTGLAGIPVFLFIFYSFFKRFLGKLDPIKIDGIYSVIYPAGIVIFIAAAGLGLFHSDPDHYLLNVQFYFLKSLPYLQFSIYTLLIFPLIFYFLVNNKDAESPRIEKCLRVFFTVLYIYMFLLLFFINIFTINLTAENAKMFNSLWSFSALYYPMTQAAAGVPMLINGFTSTYGLYPQFLAPVFSLTGLNVLKFSIVMSFMLCLSFGFLMIFLFRNTASRVIVFLGFTTILFVSYLYGKIITWDYYFQYHPLRFFFPMMLLMLSSFYYGYRKKRLYYVSFILYSLSILWNPDSGLVVYISWLLYLCYLELENTDLKKAVLRILVHFVNAAAVLALVFGLYSLSIRLFYGSYPDLFMMFSTITVFSSLGFGMLPMPLVHPWNIVIAGYIFGFLYAAAAIVNKRADKKSALILLVCLAGTGAFSYYEGRSHNWNLVNVWCYFFILITLFADMALSAVKKTGQARAWTGILLFILSFSFMDILTNSGDLFGLFINRNNIINNSTVPESTLGPVSDGIALIRKHAAKGEKIIVLSKIFEGVYLNESGTVSAFNPGFVEFEIFMKNDVERLESVLTNDKPKIFADRLSTVYDPFFSFIWMIIGKHYKKTDSSPVMDYYEWKAD